MADWIGAAAERRPGRLAIESPQGAVSFRELDRLVGSATALDAAPGERVAIALAPGLEFVVALFACMRCAAVAVPVDLRAPRERWSTAGARTIVDRALDVGRSRGPGVHTLDATAILVHTSGTSGTPKPVPLSYGNFSERDFIPPYRSDWTPTNAGSARSRWSTSAACRSCCAARSTPPRPHERRGPTRARHPDGRWHHHAWCSVVALTLARLLDAGLARPPALRCALAGGGPVPASLIERARAAGGA